MARGSNHGALDDLDRRLMEVLQADGRKPFTEIASAFVVPESTIRARYKGLVDRGALKDTIIGEGTKIDNLVQIGHNVVVGRHCVIVAHTGIAGSTELGDFVVMGGQSGTVGHIKIGSGAQVAGAAHPTKDIAPGARVGGTPARPMAQWAREMAILAGLARRSRDGDGGGSSEDDDDA